MIKNKSDLKKLIRENIYKILEEVTQFQPGDIVKATDGEIGTVRLSKHPYYSVQQDDSGVTKSYHFDELREIQPTDPGLGKYDINESSSEDVLKLSGILVTKKELYITDILSDIRSIIGITTVSNQELPESGDNERTIINMKIDPYPFKGKPSEEIFKYIIHQIQIIPGVKAFQKRKERELKPDIPSGPTPSKIPVRSIEDL